MRFHRWVLLRRRHRWAVQWPAWAAGPGAEAFNRNIEALSDWLPTKGRVLDAGAGEGRLAARLHSDGCAVVAVDVNTELAAMVGRQRGLPAVAGDLARLPFRDGVFDSVVCIMALQELPDVAPALDEFARVTQKGGRLVVSTSHPFSTLLARTADRSLIVERPYRAGVAYRRETCRGGRKVTFVGYQHTVRDYLGSLAVRGWELIDFREGFWPNDRQWARIPRYLQFCCKKL